MDTILLNGRPVSISLLEKLKGRINKLSTNNVVPKLAAILVGNDPASQVYVNSKKKVFENHGCRSETFHFSSNFNQQEIIDLIEKLNQDDQIHGILIQLPLPKTLDSKKILNSVLPEKDVDGFHPFNLGSLLEGNPTFIPCTPNGILEIFKFYEIQVSGRHVVIIGRSNIVGKPLFALLAQKFEIGNATVTLCHTGTKNLKKHILEADILIAAVGSPKMIDGKMIKEGVDIIDVGINRIDDGSSKGYHLVGDVDTDSVLGVANSVTPVPGGVGPMTITMLLHNTVVSAERCRELELSK